MAHRGGNFGPENSLKNFRIAIEQGVEGIEFDVSVNFREANNCFVGVDQLRWSSHGPTWRRRWSTN